MFWLKYISVGLILATLCQCAPVEVDSDSNHGEREKRTLILGLLLKEFLFQQAARNLMLSATTTVAPQSSMDMPAGPSQPDLPAPLEQPAGQAPPQQNEPPTPQEPPPPPGSQPPPPGSQPLQGQPPQGSPPSVEPTQLQGAISPVGLPSFTVFGPLQSLNQQGSIFPPNFPFGVQGFRQLPFGPAPPLGAQAGPQGGPRISSNFPFNIQNGFLQQSPQQGSLLPPTGPSAPASPTTPDASGSNSQLGAPPPPTGPGADATEGQAPSPPSAAGNNAPQDPSQAAPSAAGADVSQASLNSEQSEPSAPDAGDVPQGQSGESGASSQLNSGGNAGQGLPPNLSFGQGQTGPSGPPPSFLFGPSSGVGGSQGLPPNFSFNNGLSQQNFFGQGPTGPPTPESIPTGSAQQGLPPNFSFGSGPTGPSSQSTGATNEEQDGAQNAQLESPNSGSGFSPDSPLGPLDNNLQQQFSQQPQEQQQLPVGGDQPPLSNFANLPPNFQLANGQVQSNQVNLGQFDPRQFSGADNNIFDFSQRGLSPNSNFGNQDQPRPEQQFGNNFQNAFFPSNVNQQFDSQNSNPQAANFAPREGQQFDFAAAFQGGRSFQRNPFRRNFK